jgi:hypothetical protein
MGIIARMVRDDEAAARTVLGRMRHVVAGAVREVGSLQVRLPPTRGGRAVREVGSLQVRLPPTRGGRGCARGGQPAGEVTPHTWWPGLCARWAACR